MIDFSKIKTFSIKERKNKVKLADLAYPEKLLAGNAGNFGFGISDNSTIADLASVARNIKTAAQNKKEIIVMMGGHVIKTGMSPLIINLMEKGFITHIASNGAAAIHDFELAMIGETSEDVAANIEDGTFGMSEETGRYMNEAVKSGFNKGSGYGKAVGRKIEEMDIPYKKISIFYNAYKLGIPATVHVAIGTDIIHQHPECSGQAVGFCSYEDFKIFADTVSRLESGVIVNIGSAVMMPEVFLKALTIARNLGYRVEKFTAANLDMIRHYRPMANIVERPTSLGGEGYYIVERHEKTVPSLWKMLVG